MASFDKAAAAGYRACRILVPDPPRAIKDGLYQNAVRKRWHELKEKGGATADFAIDGGDLLTPGDAGIVATTIQPLHPLWFDEPCAVSNLQTTRKIREESVVRRGCGCTITNPGAFQELLREGLIDVVRPTSRAKASLAPGVLPRWPKPTTSPWLRIMKEDPPPRA